MLADSNTLSRVMGSRKSSGELRYFNEDEEEEADEANEARISFVETQQQHHLPDVVDCTP